MSEHDQGWKRQYLMTPRPPMFPREQAYKQLEAISEQAKKLELRVQEVQIRSDLDVFAVFGALQEASRAILTHVETLRRLLSLPPEGGKIGELSLCPPTAESLSTKEHVRHSSLSPSVRQFTISFWSQVHRNLRDSFLMSRH